MTNWKPRRDKAKNFVTPLLKWRASKDKYTKFKKAFDGTLSLVTSGVKHRRFGSSGNLDDNHHSASGCHEPTRRSLKDHCLPRSTVHFRDIQTPAEEVIWIHMPSFLSFLLLWSPVLADQGARPAVLAAGRMLEILKDSVSPTLTIPISNCHRHRHEGGCLEIAMSYKHKLHPR
ncbi:hypothetical protein ARMSODRAFT_975411 [Armillaria solidipes]|uniref:Uncharacterized protein n=1 Tax=Armillaria solidipes TaxID=1076256 RepID=A0A2H3BSW6_9AGAR|nr:hypothetical protein ARMSODRAFT_975411 [Armillaria solidipes]